LTKQRLDEATMILLYEGPTERPGVLDAQSELLQRRCQDLLSAIFLQGLPELAPGMLIVGERQGAELTLRKVAARLDPVVKLRSAEAARVSTASLRNA